MLAVLIEVSDKMLGPALLLGFAAIVWLIVVDKREAPYDHERDGF